MRLRGTPDHSTTTTTMDDDLLLNLDFGSKPPAASQGSKPAAKSKPAGSAQPRAQANHAHASSTASAHTGGQGGQLKPSGNGGGSAAGKQHGNKNQPHASAHDKQKAPMQPHRSPGSQASDKHSRDEKPSGNSRGQTQKGNGGAAKGAAAATPTQRGATWGMKKPLKTADDDDEGGIHIRGADDSEDEDVAAMVSLIRQRDEKLETELTATAVKEREGVVEFDSDDEDRGRSRKRLKYSQHANNASADQQQGATGGDAAAAGAASKAAKGSKAARPKAQELPVKHVPGQLGRTEVRDMPASQAQQVFGSAGKDASWEGAGVDPGLADQLRSLNFEIPTRVQQGAIPHLLARRDALVRAPTGSGKTLSYLVPIVQDLAQQEPRISRGEGTYAVIVAPTRELCIQIQDVAVLLMRKYWWLVPGILIGGENRAHEKARLRKGLSVLAASPGRLLDHLQNTNSFRTDELRWLVLDEADRLLDLGFEARLKEIMGLLDARSKAAHGDEGPAQRRTVLLSATLHSQLGQLASVSMKDPVAVGFTVKQDGGELQVSMGPGGGDDGSNDGAKGQQQGGAGMEQLLAQADDGTFEIPKQLRQTYMEVPPKQRLMTLAGLLRRTVQRPPRPSKGAAADGGKAGDGSSNKAGAKVVVFLSSCAGVDLHHALLGEFWSSACGVKLLEGSTPLLKLHGDMPQAQRTASFLKFCEATSAVLLCTDVAARGLDFPHVSTIVQFDVPGAPAEYVHRVGRTARMGQAGNAVLFLMPHELPYKDLLASKGVQLQEESMDGALRWLPLIQDNADQQSKSRKGDSSAAALKNSNAAAFPLQRVMMQAVGGDKEMRQLASDAFRSFVRAYATHSGALKRVFHVRSLHLGHIAFSHGLKDTPTLLGTSGSSAERKRKRAKEVLDQQRSNKKKLFKNAAMKAKE